MIDRCLENVVIILVATLVVSPSFAYESKNAPQADKTPKQLENVGIEEQLGERVDLTLEFTNEAGDTVSLGQYFAKQKPVLLTLVYYNCPGLCNYHLNGLTQAMSQMKWSVGEEFELVAVSFDHTEGAQLARDKKTSYIESYGRPESSDGWHMLTGSEENIKKLSEQVGFSFRWNEEEQQYAHASAAYVMTPGGKISRYLYGLEFDPKTIRLSLLEASNGEIGNLVDKVILYCFQYNPSKNKYTLYAYNIMRLGAVLAVLLLAIFLIPTWLRERHRHRALKGENS